MDKNPEVCILLPTYKREKLISRAINSILSQSYKNFRLIVVDDNTPDNTEHVVKAYNDKRIKYIKNTLNIGHPINFARCMDLVENDFFMIFGDDDEMMPKALELLTQGESSLLDQSRMAVNQANQRFQSVELSDPLDFMWSMLVVSIQNPRLSLQGLIRKAVGLNDATLSEMEIAFRDERALPGELAQEARGILEGRVLAKTPDATWVRPKIPLVLANSIEHPIVSEGDLLGIKGVGQRTIDLLKEAGVVGQGEVQRQRKERLEEKRDILEMRLAVDPGNEKAGLELKEIRIEIEDMDRASKLGERSEIGARRAFERFASTASEEDREIVETGINKALDSNERLKRDVFDATFKEYLNMVVRLEKELKIFPDRDDLKKRYRIYNGKLQELMELQAQPLSEFRISLLLDDGIVDESGAVAFRMLMPGIGRCGVVSMRLLLAANGIQESDDVIADRLAQATLEEIASGNIVPEEYADAGEISVLGRPMKIVAEGFGLVDPEWAEGVDFDALSNILRANPGRAALVHAAQDGNTPLYGHYLAVTGLVYDNSGDVVGVRLIEVDKGELWIARDAFEQYYTGRILMPQYQMDSASPTLVEEDEELNDFGGNSSYVPLFYSSMDMRSGTD